MQENNSQIIIYQTESGETKLDVRFQDETVWLTQKLMAELFQTSVPNINMHLKSIFEEGELKEKATIKDFLIVQKEGNREVKRKQIFYNLDAIISVGYRIKSHVATKFRQWATKHIREFIVKGFVLDDERLKNPDLPFDYFEELERRIQDIRTSEKRFYRKITDIYATSVDYDPTLDISINFFKTVQNKLHWAITGKTASEIIIERADSSKQNMSLTTWRGDKIRKSDVSIAKNYLNEKELTELNNLVEQYLIFAQGQAQRRIPMYMKNWIEKLNGFLSLNDREILQNAGSISHELAKENAEREYKKFKMQEQKAIKESDFDKVIKKLEKKNKK
ncbi:MAG: virulence RhuM family protein [Bacteroidales bacterium]|nr:virulence RhuM family protein [Bacteroidales bacterium]